MVGGLKQSRSLAHPQLPASGSTLERFHTTTTSCAKVHVSSSPSSAAPKPTVCLELSARRIDHVGNQLKFLIRNQSRRLSLHERQRYESRIATVINIYHKILNLSPLSAQISCSSVSGNFKLCPYNHGQLSMLECRQAVLDYIENLNGYCDSINILRLIMKSITMTGVMQAFDHITEKITSAHQS